MNIVFIRQHIVDDMYGIKVYPGRTGVLIEETTGTVQLDSPGMDEPREVVYGLIDSVQPGCYIEKRDDVN